MSAKTIPIDLDLGNFIWLKSRSVGSGKRSLSEIVNEIIAKARSGEPVKAKKSESVIGLASIAADDPDLEQADEAVQAYFRDSL